MYRIAVALITLFMMASISDAVRIDTDRIAQLLNFWEYRYTDSTCSQIASLYKEIRRLNLKEHNAAQQREIVLLMGINKDRRYRKSIDSLLRSTDNSDLKGVCYFYMYQSGEEESLTKFLALLDRQCDSIGDAGLLQALAFIKKPDIALTFLNDRIGNNDGVGSELMLETLDVLTIRMKGSIDSRKYPNLGKYLKSK